MEYRFKNQVRPLDFWILSMHHTYHSMVGLCNIIFTAAMIALTCRYAGKVHDILEVLMFLGCILFPILQPFVVYLKSKAQASMLPEKMDLEFDDKGLHVTVGVQTEDIPWKKIVSVQKEYNMVIVRSDARHGYIITNRMMKDKKNQFWADISSKIKKN